MRIPRSAPRSCSKTSPACGSWIARSDMSRQRQGLLDAAPAMPQAARHPPGANRHTVIDPRPRLGWLDVRPMTGRRSLLGAELRATAVAGSVVLVATLVAFIVDISGARMAPHTSGWLRWDESSISLRSASSESVDSTQRPSDPHSLVFPHAHQTRERRHRCSRS